jgi:hypothetical protein
MTGVREHGPDGKAIADPMAARGAVNPENLPHRVSPFR